MENNPVGMITLYGQKQTEAFTEALKTAAMMFSTGHDEYGLGEDASISIKAITRTCFRVEVSGFVETKDED